MTHDGLGKYLKEKITKAPGETADIVGVLKESRADVLVCYLPVGSEEATKWYVEQALKAGVGFVNCLPVFTPRENSGDKRFEEAGLPIIGDDIKSQVGATIVHRQLARLFHDRGVRMERTSQLNVGGNMDFYNMLEREVWDSPNSAGVVIDAVRLIKLALNNGIAGQLDGPSSYLMKSPHTQRPDDEAREQTEEYIAANRRGAGPSGTATPEPGTAKPAS